MPRITVVLAALALVASCKDQGPQGKDPTVLFHNAQGLLSPVRMAWYDQSGQAQFESFAAFETRCVHFTSTLPTDSVRYVIAVGDTTGQNGQWSKSWSPWFDPSTGLSADSSAYPFGAEYWTITIEDQGGILMNAVAAPPC